MNKSKRTKIPDKIYGEKRAIQLNRMEQEKFDIYFFVIFNCYCKIESRH